MNANPSKTCFVISPIGEADSQIYKEFDFFLKKAIKPAVEKSGYGFEVIRADEILRPGLIINDILEQISSAFIVIADLTNQNPNVFYELGVRHALSPRTILIARSIKDIPSDLTGNRAISYDISPGNPQNLDN